MRIRLGDGHDETDVEAAVSVYERSNLARRHGVWPNRAERVEQVRALIRDPETWFLLALDGTAPVGMASLRPLLADFGAGPVIPDGCFLGYLFVVPERWRQGVGGMVLDAVLAEARARGNTQIHLGTSQDNEPAHRLYRSRGFSPTGRVADNNEGEWAREL
jgi:GNAT superfamily N-acetyltransferase